jgi:hypothetical protein
LFIFYLNDVCSSIPNAVLNCFADDAKLYKSITTISDFDLLQNDISNLTKWALSWQLDISVSKCAVLDIVPVNDEYYCDTEINDIVLELCTTKCDLGIIIDRKLSFSAHIHSITARARQRINLIFRVFKTRNCAYLLRGFNAYVLPIVSYCSPVWSPYKLSDILHLESVQRAFTKRLLNFEEMSYGKRLSLLNLETLEKRRLYADLILCFKLVLGFCNRPLRNYGIRIAENRKYTRGHDFKLVFDHCRIDARLHFFGPRVATIWNSLPAEIVNMPSVICFKNAITKFDFSKFLVLNFPA